MNAAANHLMAATSWCCGELSVYRAGRVSPRFKTAAVASGAAGALIVAATRASILATSAHAISGEVVSPAGLLAGAFCALTALAALVCHCRRVVSDVLDAVIFGALPLAAGFPGWIIVTFAQDEPASQRWSLTGIAAAGIIVMGYARFALRSAFCQSPREGA
jgi:hypothetical protein